MRRTLADRALLVLTAASVAAAGAAASPSAPLVRVDDGLLQGRTVAGVNEFLGIPYAAPPTGSLRWTPPQAPAAWSGTRDATAYANNCAQSKFFTPPIQPTSEDCLYLNVFCPAAAAAQPRAVMFWVHGGGYVGGGSREERLNGTADALNGDVCVVTHNYRLNVFGFLGAEALRSRTGKGSSTGNYGILDQRAALQWVSRNIAAFGGDPKRVFLVGESAGAGSVSVHLASPASWPYFSRAGMESGAMSYWVAASMAAHEQQFSAVLESLDCESRASGVDCLLSKTTDELLNATVGPRVDMSVGGVEVLQTPFNPAIDGVVLTDAPWALGAAGKLAPVPVIAGSNRDEGASFIPSVLHCSPNCTVAEVRAWWGSTVGTAHVAQLEELYPFTGTDAPPPGGTQAWMAAQRSYGDYIMSCSARRLSRWVTASGHAAFLYLFTYISPARGAPPLVYHAADIPYVFDVATLLPDASGAQDSAAAMSTYWTTFAKLATPNTQHGRAAALPHWPAFDAAAEGGWVNITASPAAHTSPLKGAACDFWDKVGNLQPTR